MRVAALPSSVNVPNALTVGRIFIVPVLVVALLEDPHGSSAAATLFALGALSDALDGHIARARDMVTNVGKLLDPFADKLFVGAALVALVAVDSLAVWVAVVVLGRELLVTGLRFVAAQQGTVIAASSLGKVKMAMQVAAIMALIAVEDPGAAWIDGLVLATVAITVVSGADYFRGFLRGRAAAQPA